MHFLFTLFSNGMVSTLQQVAVVSMMVPRFHPLTLFPGTVHTQLSFKIYRMAVENDASWDRATIKMRDLYVSISDFSSLISSGLQHGVVHVTNGDQSLPLL